MSRELFAPVTQAQSAKIPTGVAKLRC